MSRKELHNLKAHINLFRDILYKISNKADKLHEAGAKVDISWSYEEGVYKGTCDFPDVIKGISDTFETLVKNSLPLFETIINDYDEIVKKEGWNE